MHLSWPQAVKHACVFMGSICTKCTFHLILLWFLFIYFKEFSLKDKQKKVGKSTGMQSRNHLPLFITPKMFDNGLWIRLEIGLEAPYKGFNVFSEKLAYSAHLYK